MHKKKQTFSRIWRIEEDNYEAAANRFTLKCQLISLLLLVAMWVLNLLDVFIIDKHIMTTAIIACYCIEAMTILCCAMFGYEKWWMKYIVLFLSVLMTTVAGIFLTYHVVLACVLPLLYSMQYRRRHVVYYTYILTFFSMMAIVLIGYYEGICDANMVLHTTGNISQYMNHETQTIIFDTVSNNPMMLPLFYVLPRMIILLAMIPVMQHVVKTATKHAAIESELKHLSEIDEMTHLYNRNKYNQMRESYFPKIGRIAVIFWDLNGLKKTNDTLGHEVGDYLITVFAKTIFNLSNSTRFAYRIGGDEFVLIIESPKHNDKELILQEWRQGLESMNRSSKVPISASVGYAEGKGSEIEELITQADQMMYADKIRTKSGRDM